MYGARAGKLCLRNVHRASKRLSVGYQSSAFSACTRHHGPFQLAIIGSGPAGFYTAAKVMQRLPEARVDMFEQLPVPFGLVRFGVAPDHPEVKNCEDKFTEVAGSPRFQFFGNVHVGTALSLAALRDSYDAILFAYGASKDRTLGIPGEDLHGIYSARSFVGWYNGLPEFADLNPDLDSSDTAVIIGQGNVALDVARILLCGIDHLKRTDIAEQALETLQKSRVKHVRVVGRRGPMQAAFSIKEVRELLQLPDVRFKSIATDLLPPKDYQLPRAPKRIAQLLTKYSTGQPNEQASKTFALDFLKSPQTFYGQSSTSNALSGVELQHNVWQSENDKFAKDAKVVGTEHVSYVDTGLAFRSIGYKAEPLPGMEEIGVDFDQRAGRVRNDDGRILSNGQVAPGLYCTGWAKSGPTGVIASTMEDSFATAERIAKDWEGCTSDKPGSEGIRSTIRDPVDWFGWQRIDLAERARGKERGKAREKFTTVRQMLEAA